MRGHGRERGVSGGGGMARRARRQRRGDRTATGEGPWQRRRHIEMRCVWREDGIHQRRSVVIFTFEGNLGPAKQDYRKGDVGARRKRAVAEEARSEGEGLHGRTHRCRRCRCRCHCRELRLHQRRVVVAQQRRAPVPGQRADGSCPASTRLRWCGHSLIRSHSGAERSGTLMQRVPD